MADPTASSDSVEGDLCEAGELDLCARIAEVPLLVHQLAAPHAGTPALPPTRDLSPDQLAAALTSLAYWALHEPRPGRTETLTIARGDGEVRRNLAPLLTSPAPPCSTDGGAAITLELEHRDRGDASQFIWLCLSRRTAAGALVALDSGARSAHELLELPPSVPDLPALCEPEPDRCEAEPEPDACEEVEWIPGHVRSATYHELRDQPALLELCLAPAFQVECDGRVFPTARDVAAGRHLFNTRFHEIFPESSIGSTIRFRGLAPPRSREPPIKYRTRFNEKCDHGVQRISPENSHRIMRQYGISRRHFEAVEAYGNREGGWFALQTYDGPKMSLGWSQLTFGPNPGPVHAVTQGWGKNFMAWLHHRDPACFRRCFGIHGLRVSWKNPAARDATPGRVDAAVHADTYFWRIPCCPDQLPMKQPDGDLFIPPNDWLVQRWLTTTVGFVGAAVQAFRDPDFCRIMVAWISAMLDRAAEAAGTDPTVAQVAVTLRDHFIKPGEKYKLQCEEHPSPRWSARYHDIE